MVPFGPGPRHSSLTLTPLELCISYHFPAASSSHPLNPLGIIFKLCVCVPPAQFRSPPPPPPSIPPGPMGGWGGGGGGGGAGA